jgi:hypothetical protein
MENTKVTLNDLKAFVSKLGTLVERLDSERREFAKNTLGTAQEILKTETVTR